MHLPDVVGPTSYRPPYFVFGRTPCLSFSYRLPVVHGRELSMNGDRWPNIACQRALVECRLGLSVMVIISNHVGRWISGTGTVLSARSVGTTTIHDSWIQSMQIQHWYEFECNQWLYLWNTKRKHENIPGAAGLSVLLEREVTHLRYEPTDFGAWYVDVLSSR